ncbi:MAG TPA: Uma2 family endonuclease [Firmicutes bacterium]|nr:Uma2 family endonuclease [Bacillota bacterium]
MEVVHPDVELMEEGYFSLPEVGRIVELTDGRIAMPPHPTHTHQITVGKLYRRMIEYVEVNNLGIVQIAPLPVRLWPGKIREPDILFVAKGHEDRIGEQVYGVPDLVVEVVSAHSRETDYGERKGEYERAGIREYWIVDPDEGTISAYVLREKKYELLGRWKKGEVVRSETLDGFEVAVEDILG